MSSSSNDSPPPPKVRGLFGKKSLPPPPAGRGPLNTTTAGIGPRADTPRPQPAHVPDLPPGVQAQDDPLADFFDGSAQPVVLDAPAPRAADVVVAAVGNDAVTDAPPKPPPLPASVARVGLAKTLIGGPAHEVMATEARHDPRSDPDATPPGGAVIPEHALRGVVFDPDQSVARHLGEASLDATLASTAGSTIAANDGSRGLSDPRELSAGLDLDSIPSARPKRSMRSAMMIIGLILISGAAATAFSLGIIGGPPSRLRTQPVPAAAAQPTVTASQTAHAATAPPAKAPMSPTAPTPIDPPAAVVEPVAVELGTAAVEPMQVAADSVVAAAPIVTAAPVVSGDPVAAGDALVRAHDLAGAAVQYRAALAADPEDHHAMEGIARVHLALGEPQLALPFAEAIVKRRPKRESYRALLNETQRAIGR